MFKFLPSLAVLVFIAAPVGAQITGSNAADSISRENRPRNDSVAGNSVDTGTGAFVFGKTLLQVQGRRSLDFSIVYNSLLTRSQGMLGYGFSTSYDAYIGGDPSSVMTVHWDANLQNSFRAVTGSSTYEPIDEAARYDVLTSNSSGYRVTRPSGMVYEFSKDGGLTRIGNKIQQFIEVSRSNGRVTNISEPGSNKQISFHYRQDGSGLLEWIRDAADRVVYFKYDAFGRLITLRNPVTQGPNVGDSFSPKTIPDNSPQGLTYSIDVTRTDPIGLVMLFQANISHPRPSDLTVTMISPRGTRLTLLGSGSSLDFSDTILDAFEGENPQGTWRVNIVDARSGTTGTLNGWKLIFTDPTNPVDYTYDGAGRITFARGPDGERLFANSYDAQGRVVSQDDGVDTNQIATFAYEDSGSGVKTTYTDRMANAHVYIHDAGYHLLQTIDPLGNATRYSYDQSGNRASVTDPLGHTSRFSFDSDGNLISVIDPAQDVTVMAYDSRHNVTSIRDPLGYSSTFSYDSNNNVTSVSDALSNRDRKIFGGNSEMTGNLLADGAGINYTYSSGMPVTVSTPANQGSARAVYDNVGRAIRVTDTSGNSTSTTYNTSDQVTSTTDALGLVERKDYDRRNRLVRELDKRGNQTLYTYDGNDNILTRIDALGQVTSYRYDGEDRMVGATDAAGNSTSTIFDAAGRMLAVIDPLGHSGRFTYNADGSVIEVRGPDGALLRKTTYDSRHLPILRVDAYGRTTRMNYDAASNPVEVQSPLNRTVNLTYDKLGRLSLTSDALKRVAKRTYESDDVLSTLEDAAGGEVTFHYDPANRISSIERYYGSTNFQYDGRDLMTRETSAAGRRHDYTYDSEGRLVTITGRIGSGAVTTTTRKYDEAGNVTQVTSQVGSGTSGVALNRVFDALNRLTAFTDADGSTLRYVYDAAGNLVTLQYPDGKAVAYTYDKANRLVSLRDWAGRVTRYTYDVNGKVERIQFPNGTVRTMEFEPGGRMAHNRDLSPQGAVIAEYRYTYDGAGMIIGEGALSASQTPPASAAITYAKDNRIATFNGQPVTYDSDGNLTRGPLEAITADFSYDEDNNLLRAGVSSYGYDVEDRLVSLSSGGGTTRLTVSPGPGMSRILVSRAPDGVVTRYVYGLGLLYEDVGGELRVHHYDLRGNTVAMTDANGTVTGSAAYSPFGAIVKRTGDTSTLLLAGGRDGVLTDSNGLVYMRYRWYSPVLRRFLTPDAHFGDISRQASLNQYSFGFNNPVNLTDPSGQNPAILFGAVLGALVGVAGNLIARGIDSAVHHKPFVEKGQEWNFVGELAGSALSGAIVGGAIGACGPCAASASTAIGVGFGAGLVAGAAGNALKQGIRIGGNHFFAHNDDVKFDVVDFAIETGLGGVAGAIPVARGAAAVEEEALFRAAVEVPTAAGVIKVAVPLGAREAAAIQTGEVLADLLVETSEHLANHSIESAREEGERNAGESGAGEVGGSGEEESATSVRVAGLNQIYAGKKATFGEYAHFAFYQAMMRLAARALPANPHPALASF